MADGPTIISRADAAKAGLKHYFTSKPCKHGHVAERRTATGHCVECHREEDRKRYAANPERERERKRERKRERYAANPERAREQNRAWRAANPERARDQHRDYVRERQANDPAYKLVRALRSRMRAVLKGKSKSARSLELFGVDPDWYVAEMLPHLLRTFSTKYGVEMTLANHGKVWHFDHCEPLSSFNLNDPAEQRQAFHYGNLRPLPAAVNLTKSTKAPDPNDLWVGMLSPPMAA